MWGNSTHIFFSSLMIDDQILVHKTFIFYFQSWGIETGSNHRMLVHRLMSLQNPQLLRNHACGGFNECSVGKTHGDFSFESGNDYTWVTLGKISTLCRLLNFYLCGFDFLDPLFSHGVWCPSLRRTVRVKPRRSFCWPGG